MGFCLGRVNCLLVLLSIGVGGDGLSFHSPDDSWDNKPNECKALRDEPAANTELFRPD
jgi:hypothetical protein